MLDSDQSNNPIKEPLNAKRRKPRLHFHVMSFGVRLMFWFIAAMTIAGIVDRWTIRDGRYLTSVLFYATPPPLLICGAALCLFNAARQRRRWPVRFWLLLLIAVTGHWFWADWRFQSSAASSSQIDEVHKSSDEVSVLFWNVARRQDLSAAAAFLREKDPDIIGLVEVDGDVTAWKKFWKENLPGHDVSALGNSMYLLSKGTSGETIPISLQGSSQARRLTVHLRGIDYEVILVDIFANPLHFRKIPLQKLTDLADSLADRRVLIMGDFNTPADSTWLVGLRKNHQLLFEAVGRGYSGTWPTLLPLMQLDQIWTNAKIIPIRCRHNWTWSSDHQPVEAIIRPAP